MKELVDTTQMYLRTILELEEEGITPLRARIAERLEQSGPTGFNGEKSIALHTCYCLTDSRT